MPKRLYLSTKRLERGLSKTTVAQKLGISLQYYKFIEDGERQIDMSLSVANGLAEIFGLSISEINDYEADWLKAAKEEDNEQQRKKSGI